MDSVHVKRIVSNVDQLLKNVGYGETDENVLSGVIPLKRQNTDENGI